MKGGKRKDGKPIRLRLPDKWKGLVGQYGKYGVCVLAGILAYGAVELLSSGGESISSGRLRRSPSGGGDLSYEFYVEGLEEEAVPVTLNVPEQKLSAEQLQDVLPEVAALLCERIIGENLSLYEVREDLKLVKELPEYGLTVSWNSDSPEIVSDLGVIGEDACTGEKTVYLRATISNGLCGEAVEIPVTVLPRTLTEKERFLLELETLTEEEPEAGEVVLPSEFDGRTLKYRGSGKSGNQALILLGILAAGCLSLKERNDKEKARKKREDSLILDYPEIISRFLVLTGAGYPVKQVWKKQVTEYERAGKQGYHPIYEEMAITLNQMETGTPENRAYAEFGRRVGVRCYVKFASLLESSLSVGGKNLRTLLGAEMEEAFNQRKDLARRKGEEASTKLLLPLFLLLGVVMVMVTAPAFLTLG